jgi:translocation and assembly module TamB
VLPDDEILARVLFDRSVSGLTPIQAIRVARLVNKLAGREDAFRFLDSARELMGVDRLEFNQSTDDPSGTSISAGKYLSGDIYVEVEKSLGKQGGGISVEKQLTPHISVESEVGVDRGSSIGVKWRKDY